MADSNSSTGRLHGTIISGDCVVIQGAAWNGPPPESTVYLSGVLAPRLGRRPTGDSPTTADEPFAWEAREFLRKKLLGQNVNFVRDYMAGSREVGRIYLGGTNPDNAENVTESAIAAGWLEVKPGRNDTYFIKLAELQDQAKIAKNGKWADNSKGVRDVKSVTKDLREFVDKYKQKPIDAIVEMVRDGSTLRILLLPNFEYITLQLSGVRAPSTSRDDRPGEPFGDEAKHFVETRILQQDVQVVLESTVNQNFVGSVFHPRGNIAEALLREGFAKCVDWSIGLCTEGSEKMRAAEKQAKEKKLRLWRAYQTPSTLNREIYKAKVMEVSMNDSLIVEKDDGTEVKIYLSSVRMPRENVKDDKPAVGRQYRPLYDIPHMFRAREFLRKRLVGKVVTVTVDYVQPKTDSFPEKTCCTVKVGDVNIAEALVAKGLSRVVRYRADDESRSGEYDLLLSAETAAEKNKKGLFAGNDKKEVMRVQEVQNDQARSKQFLPLLQKGDGIRLEAVVEFVTSGSRVKLYIPKSTAIINFIFAGIICPRSAPKGSKAADEPFCHEAAAFTRRMLMQREVQIEVDGVDKMGNFVGYLFFTQEDGGALCNISELLLEQGLATIHSSAETKTYFSAMNAASEKAKDTKKNLMSIEQEVDTETKYKKVSVVDVVKVLSGDTIIVQTHGVDNAEGTAVNLKSVVAPRLGKRPTENTSGTDDEPFAWEAREFLRKKLVGRIVTLVRDFVSNAGREHGRVYTCGKEPEDAEDVIELAVNAGWLEVKAGRNDSYGASLMELQSEARNQKVGRWNSEAPQIHKMTFVPGCQEIVDKYKQKPIDAIVEMVRDGSTLRILLLPNFEYITLQLSGVRAPSTSRDDRPGEPFGDEAKHFVETRILQQDVQVVLESTVNQNFVGSVFHPRGNIAEALLREGFAKCVDWSIGLCTEGSEKMRAAEKQAKEKKLRLWRAYQTPSTLNREIYKAKVMEVSMNDSLIVEKDDGTEVKIYLSSVRMPRENVKDDKPAVGRQYRPLYDIPHMFRAREFLRKRLVGKVVTVTVDYVQPKTDSFPEKTCCTVKVGDVNIAEALVAKGLSRVVRYRADDESRSGEYDLLLSAETAAEKNKKGLFAGNDKKEVMRVQEVQNDQARSKQFLPLLQKGDGIRLEAVVEFVTSGSRVKLYIPKSTAIINFIFAGIICPRSAPKGSKAADEPFCHEAAAFTRRMLMQREVQIEVDGVDKMGNFVGYLFFTQEDGGALCNISELLLEQGLATIHSSAERTKYYKLMYSAEERAKHSKRNIWINHKELPTEDEVQLQEVSVRKIKHKKIVITEAIKGSLNFYAQLVDEGKKLEQMTEDMRNYVKNHPPMSGTYQPKRGELCLALFSQDGLWYRARVEAVHGPQTDVIFIDYGNREAVPSTSCAAIPSEFAKCSPAAREYALALVLIPNDKDYAQQCFETFEKIIFSYPNAEINLEFKASSVDHVQLFVDSATGKEDVGKSLIAHGFAQVDKRKEARLQALMHEYIEVEQAARTERLNIWEFGDFTGRDL